MLGIDGAAQWLHDPERVTWFTTPAGMGVHIAPSALTPTVLENVKDPGSESALRDPSPEPTPLVCPLTETYTVSVSLWVQLLTEVEEVAGSSQTQGGPGCDSWEVRDLGQGL